MPLKRKRNLTLNKGVMGDEQMAGIKRSRKLNRVFKVLNHAIIIICVVGFAFVVALVEAPFEKALDFEMPRISLDDLFQQAKNTALQLEFQLVNENVDARKAEFEKRKNTAKSRLEIRVERVENSETGLEHHWILVNVQNQGFAAKFTFPSPEDISKAFLELLDSNLMELI